MAKSKLIEEQELNEKELQQVSEALAEKVLQEEASPKQIILNDKKESVKSPGHTTRAFRQ